MRNSLKWQWLLQKKLYLLVFAIPVIIMFCAYGNFGVHPFGRNSVLVLDLNAQYVYYFEYLRDSFWGHQSIIYSWSRNLSGEMFGIFAYYLASPFVLIPILLPRGMILGSLEIMQLCKLGAAAITFAVYLKNRKDSKLFTILIFSVIYSLMAYSVVQLMNPMWLDGIVYLPLIIMGTERLIDEGRRLGFIIPLALMFMANFYIGYMIGIFTGIYFVYYILKSDDFMGFKELGKTILNFAVSVIAAAMSAMFIIFPAYNSLKLGKMGFSKPDYTLKTQFPIMQFFTKLLPFSYDTVRPEGMPIIYCGLLTVILIPLFFMNRNIRTRQKVSDGILLSIMFLCMYLSTVDLAWHGFQVPNWLPFRYSFMFCFVMIMMAVQAFEHLEGISYREIGGAFFGILIFLFFAEGQKYKNITALDTILPSIGILVVYFLLLFCLKKYKFQMISIATLVFVCAELFAASLQTLDAINKDVVYSGYSSYYDFVNTGRTVVNKITAQDNSLYRSEKTYFRAVNDPMAFGLKGISHSSSTMNSPVIELLSELGFTSRGHSTRYSGATEVTDALFGIKYILSKDKKLVDYEKLFTYEDVNVYKNPNALSIGFMADKNIENTKLDDINPFINQNKFVNSMINGGSEPVFRKIFPDDTVYQNVNVANAGDHVKYSQVESGLDTYIQFKLTAPTDDMIYLFFPSQYEREVNLWINGDFVSQYYEADNYCIMPVGKFKKGDQITVQTTLTKPELYMQDQCFYYLNTERLKYVVSEFRKNQWNISEYSDTYIKGEITAGENQVMFTSIPYEPGWNIQVDGKDVKPVKLLNSLIGIDVPAGKHTVTMKFFPQYYTTGIIISLAGVILIVILGIFEKRSKRLLLNRLYK